jgi:hypothetical protein
MLQVRDNNADSPLDMYEIPRLEALIFPVRICFVFEMTDEKKVPCCLKSSI